ncbi:MAG: CvpA family protein, partial [Clostridia bacterium]|nr:CvpA family protein [Clostridia bacterium]
TNQRTKDTKFYSIAGAEDFSAMASAESKVQQMNYVATFPLLLNIADQPTYFMALKGNDGLVKMYAMVNVRQYSNVATGATVVECEQNYRSDLVNFGLIDSAQGALDPTDTATVTGTVADIREAVMDGNTHYFVKLIGDDRYFVISAADDADAVILNKGDQVEILCGSEAEGTIIPTYGVTLR